MNRSIVVKALHPVVDAKFHITSSQSSHCYSKEEIATMVSVCTKCHVLMRLSPSVLNINIYRRPQSRCNTVIGNRILIQLAGRGLKDSNFLKTPVGTSS